MSSHTKGSLILAGILALALMAMAGLLAQDWVRSQVLGQTSGHALVADIDRWRKTRRERVVRSRYDLAVGRLHQVPLQVGAWQGQDMPQDNIEVQILLEPEEYVYRRYRRADGAILWLSLIGSHQSKSFHPPQICYDSAGWATQVTSTAIPLARGDVYAMQVRAQKPPWTHMAFYFYLFPDYLRDPSQGIVLFKVTVPVGQDPDEARQLAADFMQQIFLEARPSS